MDSLNAVLNTARKDYMSQVLFETDVDPNPFKEFEKWCNRAREKQIFEPNAMVLSTATKEGVPSSRVVLLRGVDGNGFTFFTNYHSRKGREIESNPFVSLNFWWQENAVRVEGVARHTSAAESDAYFATRPRTSQLGAWASAQSEVLASGRDELELKLAQLALRFENAEIPRPEWWGGYCVVPRVMEFWQGRPSRLHDRLRYTRSEEGAPWILERLSP